MLIAGFLSGQDLWVITRLGSPYQPNSYTLTPHPHRKERNSFLPRLLALNVLWQFIVLAHHRSLQPLYEPTPTRNAEAGLTGSIRPPNRKGRISKIYPRAYNLEGELFTHEKEIWVGPWCRNLHPLPPRAPPRCGRRPNWIYSSSKP